MKLGDLNAKLQAMESKYGYDFEVTICSHPENNPDKEPTDPYICTILWRGDDDKPTSLMICDRFTYSELL